MSSKFSMKDKLIPLALNELLGFARGTKVLFPFIYSFNLINIKPYACAKLTNAFDTLAGNIRTCSSI